MQNNESTKAIVTKRLWKKEMCLAFWNKVIKKNTHSKNFKKAHDLPLDYSIIWFLQIRKEKMEELKDEVTKERRK